MNWFDLNLRSQPPKGTVQQLLFFCEEKKCCCSCGGLWVMKAIVFLSFLLVGYGRCPRQGLRQKEENERKNNWLIHEQQKQFKSSAGWLREEWNWTNWWNQWSEIEFSRCPTNQAKHQAAPAARQAHSATLLFVGPLCALKKEDNCWNGWGCSSLFSWAGYGLPPLYRGSIPLHWIPFNSTSAALLVLHSTQEDKSSPLKRE